jgi:glycosyltransferase involved in cell wall biosynthesis
MPDLPVISIITVTFNDRENLRKTLQSVAGQDYPAIEHVIVDGGSTDGTAEIIEAYKLSGKRWTSGKDKGIYDAMNKGLKMATGDYVTFLNAGDFYCDGNVLTQLFGATEIPGTDVVYGDHYVFRPENPEHRYYLKAYTFSQHHLLKWGTRVVCHQAFFVRRSLAPLYDLSYRFKSELNWYFDIVGQNPGLTVRYKPIPVVFYATGGMAYQHFWKNQLEYFNLLRKRFGLRTVMKYNHHKKVLFGLTFKYDGVRKFIPKKIIEKLKPKVD